MKNWTRTFLSACLGFLLACTVGTAQKPAATDPLAGPKPYTDKQTGLTFPTEIGKLKLKEVKGYSDPKLGVGIKYQVADTLMLDVIIYNLGIEKIPSDLEGVDLKTQVNHAVDNIKTYAEKGIYRDLQLHEPKVVPLSADKDSPKSHLVAFAFTLIDIPRESRLYVFPYKNHFVKVRATWNLAERAASEKEVDGLLAWLGEKVR